MILRRDIAAALAFWLLVAGLVWLRVEIGPLDPRPQAETGAYGLSETIAAREAQRPRSSESGRE